MVKRLNLTFDAAQPQELGQFWATALGYVEESPPPGFDSWEAALEAGGFPSDRWDDFYAVVDPEEQGPRLFFQRVPEPKVAKNRLHIDVPAPGSTRDDREQKMAATRAHAQTLVEAGGSISHEFDDPHEGFWIVMTDPEGNEFCVV